jgi:hypothetical protein
LQRIINEELEKRQIAKDFMDYDDVYPIKLDKFKRENDLWNRDKLLMWKQEKNDNNAD